MAPAPAPASAGGRALAGLDALRPIAAVGTQPLGDVALLQQLGGADTVRRLSALAGVESPLVDLDGPGAAATAANAAADFTQLLTRAVAVGGPQSADLAQTFSTQPADMQEALLRLYRLVRAVQLPAASEPPRLAKPPAGLLKEVKETPPKAAAKVFLRAVPAAVLEPLTEESTWRREAT